MKHLLEDIRPLTKTSHLQNKSDVSESFTPKEDFGSIGDAPKKSKKIGIWFIVFLIIFISIFAFISYYFRIAKVIITPKTQVVDLDAKMILDSSKSSENVPYEIMTINDSIEKNKKASNSSKIEVSAKGIVIIYNTFSTNSQKLVSGTRFETKDGKIFKLKNDVTVPGRTTKDGKIVAGTAEATLYADKVGDSYNVGLVDLSIPAYKGTSRYTTLYARTKEPISGGMVGEVFTLNKEESQFAEAEMISAISFQMQTDAFKQIPAGYLAFKDAFAQEISVDTSTTSQTEEVLVTAQGSLALLLIKEEDLTSYLAKNNIKDLGEDIVHVKDWSNISLTIDNKEKLLSKGKESLSVNIKGNIIFTWHVDTETLKKKIVFIKDSLFPEIVNSFKGIAHAELNIVPFWISVTPEDISKINLSLK